MWASATDQEDNSRLQVQHASVAGTIRQHPKSDDKARSGTGAKAVEEDDVTEGSEQSEGGKCRGEKRHRTGCVNRGQALSYGKQ